MTARGIWFALGAVALAATGWTSPAAAQAATGGEPVFSDVLVSSMRERRVVASSRTDARSNFRLDLPSGDQNICLDGPSLRSALARAPGGAPQRAETLIELLVVIALADARPVGGAGGAAPATPPVLGAARSIRVPIDGSTLRSGPGPCFPVRIDAAPGPDRVRELDSNLRDSSGQATPPPTNNGDGTATNADGTIAILEFRRADPPPVGADQTGDGRRLQRDGKPVGFNNGTSELRVDPRTPPPAVRSGPAGPTAPRTTAVTGSIRLVER